MTRILPSFQPMFADIGGDIGVSFEFFPPKTPAMEETLWSSISALAPLKPEFVSVTYGAGGSTRERTHNTVSRIVRETDIKASAHLTCVAATREEVDEVARGYWAAGVRSIVALRGDPPAGIGTQYTPHPGGYESSVALIEGLKRIADFDISVSAYPECHPESPSRIADVDFLKRKLDAGANRAITQFFFDPDAYLRYLDLVHAAGVSAPILPGILPVTNVAQLRKMAAACGASVPEWMGRLFEGLDDHPTTRQLVAATVAAEMCVRLYRRGVRNFHFYTLNRSELTRAICHLLGLRDANVVQIQGAAA